MQEQRPDPNEALIDRYVAVWNEPDDARRRAAVSALWAAGGVMINRLRRYEGREGVTEGVTRSYDAFVARGFRFQAERFVSHHDAILFFWVMRDPAGQADSRGINFLALDDAGQIAIDHQFAQ
jgi:SnoaL-like domain